LEVNGEPCMMPLVGRKTLPSWIGGVAAASADGVVDKNLIRPVHHPASQSLGTPPIQEGSFYFSNIAR